MSTDNLPTTSHLLELDETDCASLANACVVAMGRVDSSSLFAGEERGRLLRLANLLRTRSVELHHEANRLADVAIKAGCPF